jgi:hypothetical protein
MATMSCADGSNFAGVPRCSKPVMDCGPNGAPLDRHIARSLVPGDQQQKAIASRYCPVERSVDCLPGTIEAHSMKIDDAIGLDGSVTKAPIPAAVERGSRPAAILALGNARWRRPGGRLRGDGGSRWKVNRFVVVLVA